MSSFTYEDLECQRILAMSPEEIRNEIIASGRTPEDVVAEVDRIIAAAKVDAYRRRMKIFV